MCRFYQLSFWFNKDSLLFELIFQALDTLGNTRWRVNKRVLSVVDRIWSNGGCLADLVDHSDVSIFSNFPQCNSFTSTFVFQELIMMTIAIKKPFSFNFFIQVPLPERPETEPFNFPSFENDL
jgi:DNA-directed RNA polymerase